MVSNDDKKKELVDIVEKVANSIGKTENEQE
jgi:hypothetical protein